MGDKRTRVALKVGSELLERGLRSMIGASGVLQLVDAAIVADVVVVDMTGPESAWVSPPRGDAAYLALVPAGVSAASRGRLLAAGFDGCLGVDATRRQFVLALGRVARQRAAQSPVAGASAVSSTVLASLTPREREVLTLICRGWSNQDIAERRYLTINTVKTYIRTAYAKIGARRRAEAVLWGVQAGLLDGPDDPQEPVAA